MVPERKEVTMLLLSLAFLAAFELFVLWLVVRFVFKPIFRLLHNPR